MCYERLKYLKDCLLCCIESQMDHLGEVDAEELGAAIDMLKDLSKTMYYTTITEAMIGEEKEKEEEESHHIAEEHHGRSHMSRKAYMEAKMASADKATQLRELEKYMQELTADIAEMIQDASLEEKSYLEKKITALATKIGQMK